MARLTEQEQQEIIGVRNEQTGQWEERWTGDYIFENDTMTIVDVTVGNKKG
jgi:hypothetical protein